MSVDARNQLLSRLPLPLAQLYARAQNDKSSRSRHDCAYYAFEALLKLAAAAAAAGYAEERRAGRAAVPAVDQALGLLDRPSEGKWLGLLRETARAFGHRVDADTHPLGHLWKHLQRHRREPDVVALYARLRRGFVETPDGRPEPPAPSVCTLYELFEVLVSYRNAIFGHPGVPRFEEFYATEMGPLLFPALTVVLNEDVFGPLGPPGTPLLFLSRLEQVADGPTATFHELTGLAPFLRKPVAVAPGDADGWAAGDLFVEWPNRSARPLRLSPFLIGAEGKANDLRVLFLNGDQKEQVEYVGYDGGEGTRRQAVAVELAALFSLAAGRPVLPADVKVAPEADDFEIEKQLGQGGMGVVYLARHRSLGTRVALKMLPAERTREPLAVSRFHREMRSLMRCNHPNIVKFLSVGRLQDGREYFAMEYVKGCTLEDVFGLLGEGAATADTWTSAVKQASTEDATPAVPTAQPAPAPGLVVPAGPVGRDYIRQVAEVVRDAAAAVREVHAQGIVHRDVKPANLMFVAETGRVVLVDFGLAKGRDVMTILQTGDQAAGTVRYMAPELLSAAGRPAEPGPRADVRSLGVTAWELLTRRRLFAQADNPQQLARLVADEDVPRLSAVGDGFDPDIEAIVWRAVERDPGQRIATAGELADYLSAYLDDRPIPIRVPGLWERTGRWARRNRAAVASAVAGTAVLAVLLGLTLVWMPDPQSVLMTDGKGGLQQTRDRAERLRRQASARLDAEDPLGALPYLAEVVGLQVHDPEREEIDRIRFREALRHCPRPVSAVDLGPTPGAVVFSPDSQWVAAGGEDGRVQVRNVQTGELAWSQVKHTKAVRFLAFSPDGSVLATAGLDRSARLWDVGTGQLLHTFDHPFAVVHAAFSSDGRRLVTSAGIHHRVTERPVAQSVTRQVEVTVKRDGKEVKELKEVVETVTTLVKEVSRDPDNPDLAEPTRGGEVRVWEVRTGRPLTPALRHPDKVVKSLFLDDDRHIVTCMVELARPRVVPVAADDRALVYASDQPGPKPREVPEGPPPAGEKKPAADPKAAPAPIVVPAVEYLVQVWDTNANGKKARFGLGHEGVLVHAAVGTAGTVYACWRSGAGVKHAMWNPVRDPDQTRSRTPSPNVAVPADSPLAWTSDPDAPSFFIAVAAQWDVIVTTLPFPRDLPASNVVAVPKPESPFQQIIHGRANLAEFSPDGRFIALAFWDRFTVGNPRAGRYLALAVPMDAAIDRLTVSPDDRFVAVLTAGRRLTIFDLSVPHPRATEADDRGSNLTWGAFSADGQTAIGYSNSDYSTTAWDWAAEPAAAAGPVLRVPNAYPAVIDRAGPYLVTLNRFGEGHVFDLRTRREVPVFEPANLQFRLVNFAPVGSALLTVRAFARPLKGGTPKDEPASDLEVWDVPQGRRLLGPVRVTGRVESADLHVGNRRAIVRYADRTVGRIDLDTGVEVGRTSPDRPVSHLLQGPNGECCLVFADGAVRLLDVGTGIETPVGLGPRPNTAPVGVRFSPDGTRLATYPTSVWGPAAEPERPIEVWDSRTGQPVGKPVSVRAPVWAVWISPDNRFLLAIHYFWTGAEGTLAQAWVVATGEPVTPIWAEPEGALAVHATGPPAEFRTLVGGAGGVRRWVPDGSPVDAETARRVASWVSRQRLDPTDELVALTGSEADDLAQELIARQAIPARSSDEVARWHVQSIRVAEFNSNWSSAERHAAALVRLDPKDDRYLQFRARSQLFVGRWRDALPLFDSLRIRTKSAYPWLMSARLLARAGDRAAARELFQQADERCRTDADRTELLYSLTVPADIFPVTPRLLAFAETRVGTVSTSCYAQHTRGSLLLRAGRYAEARVALEQSVRICDKGGTPREWLFLALAHHHLGARDKAVEFLRRGRDSYNRKVYRGGNGTTYTMDGLLWLDNEELREEAERLIGPDGNK